MVLTRGRRGRARTSNRHNGESTEYNGGQELVVHRDMCEAAVYQGWGVRKTARSNVVFYMSQHLRVFTDIPGLNTFFPCVTPIGKIRSVTRVLSGHILSHFRRVASGHSQVHKLIRGRHLMGWMKQSSCASLTSVGALGSCFFKRPCFDTGTLELCLTFVLRRVISHMCSSRPVHIIVNCSMPV